jgi:hypothetical protein
MANGGERAFDSPVSQIYVVLPFCKLLGPYITVGNRVLSPSSRANATHVVPDFISMLRVAEP